MSKERDLRARTKSFALCVIRLINSLKRNISNITISRQLIRSATSVGANYLAACHAKSKLDFLNKLKIVEEEIIETRYWLELLLETNTDMASSISSTIKETDELTAIFISSIKKVKKTL